MSAYRVIVTGGRDYADADRVRELIYLLPDDAVVVHGACTGADALAEHYALKLGLKTERHPPDLKRYGSPAAFHIRNQEMVDAGADLVLAFPGGSGTRSCVEKARTAGLIVKESRA